MYGAVAEREVVLVTPVYHRFIHRFHLETERDEGRETPPPSG